MALLCWHTAAFTPFSNVFSDNLSYTLNIIVSVFMQENSTTTSEKTEPTLYVIVEGTRHNSPQSALCQFGDFVHCHRTALEQWQWMQRNWVETSVNECPATIIRHWWPTECDDNVDNSIGLIVTSFSRLLIITLRIWRPQLTYTQTDMSRRVDTGTA